MARRRNRQACKPEPKPIAPVVSVAQEIADIQAKRAKNVNRMETIERELELLSEQNGALEIRRLQLLRDFDSSSV